MIIDTDKIRYFFAPSDPYEISGFRLWILRKIVKQALVQSHQHEANIVSMYRVIIEEARWQFSEDNEVTLVSFLDDCQQEAIHDGYIK